MSHESIYRKNLEAMTFDDVFKLAANLQNLGRLKGSLGDATKASLVARIMDWAYPSDESDYSEAVKEARYRAGRGSR